MATPFLTMAVNGNLSAFIADHNKALAKALTNTVRATTNTIRSRSQTQIRKAFKGSGQLAKALASRNDPKSGYRLDPRGRVYSKAQYDAKGSRAAAVDLLWIYQYGESVTAANHTWLAVPTKEAPQRAGRGGKRYATPRESGLKLKFLPTADPNKAVLIPQRWTRGGRPPVVYVLLKFSPRRARIDIDKEVERAVQRLPQFYAKQWAREDAALTDRYGRGLSRSGPMLLG